MAKKKPEKQAQFIDTVIKNPGRFLLIIAAAAVLIFGIAMLASPNRNNPYRTDYPKTRTTQVGSYVFDVPGKWQIGGDFSYYKDFYLDSSDRANYSRVCYAILEPTEDAPLSDFAEAFWTQLETDWSVTGAKVEYAPLTVCGSEAVEITYSGTVPGRNTNGTILLVDDEKDNGILCLTYERVGAGSSANSDFKKIKKSLRLYDGTEEITHDNWYDLNADTLQDYKFDYCVLEYNSKEYTGMNSDLNVYLYDLSDQLIFYYTLTRDEPHHVKSTWNPDNIMVYRYVGDINDGAYAYLMNTDYPDTLPTTRDWFIKGGKHSAKGNLLYDVHKRLDVDEYVKKFQDEFGKYSN